MITINGKYNFAHIMCDEVEDNVREQIKTLLDLPVFKGEQIRIMADTHFGMGCVIGLTSTLGDYVIPNIVGVDIGCGIEAYCLGKQEIDFQALDNFIRENIPSGKNVRTTRSPVLKNEKLINEAVEFVLFDNESIPFLYTIRNEAWMVFSEDKEREKKTERVFLSLGTLGGGNHFIEVDQDPEGNYWLLIHTGSRNFGLQIANYYQKEAKELARKFFLDLDDKYKNLEFLPLGTKLGGEDYLRSMRIAQNYAALNRYIITDEILSFLGYVIDITTSIKTVHNYIDIKNKIVRKGAISAQDGERVLIPINMKEGTIVGVGKGSKKWNFSAPHGAGRILGRNQAKKTLSMREYEEKMYGVWTTSVTEKTLDEAPMAYKDKRFIMDAVQETVDVQFVMKSVYNFKAQD